jgi:hypothetical protein
MTPYDLQQLLRTNPDLAAANGDQEVAPGDPFADINDALYGPRADEPKRVLARTRKRTTIKRDKSFTGFEEYRRRVMIPAGYRNESPGVWVRRNDDGSEDVYLPWTFTDGKERWQHDAEAGRAPDGTKLEETQ